MTSQESAALMLDAEFRGRVKVACVKYADAILIQPPGLGHATLLKWSASVYASPDQVASQVQPFVVMDAQVQTDGAAIADGPLQSAVEAVVNKTI